MSTSLKPSTVDISFSAISEDELHVDIERFFLQLLQHLGLSGVEISVVFCDNNFIRTLNREYRNKDEATDVLSFPQNEERFPPEGTHCGDIVISLPQVRENEKQFHVSFEEELQRLCIHGVLHLLGYDHATNNPDEPMLELQESILSRMAEEQL